ncbi:hypothetical protein KFK09_018254 [Dendrobium nobile]|uniref:Uncharacterized protein n=1 Tax=Dendrobium nobile TaxID=94219 RepID=A0A8T3ATX1_DENNO|nr:hypothetical protein KFK09_018254 [Dendrobium nobile]
MEIGRTVIGDEGLKDCRRWEIRSQVLVPVSLGRSDVDGLALSRTSGLKQDVRS